METPAERKLRELTEKRTVAVEKKRKRDETRKTVLPEQMVAWKQWWEDRNAGEEQDESAPDLDVSAMTQKELSGCYEVRFGTSAPNSNNLDWLRKRLVRDPDYIGRSKTMTYPARVVADITRAFDDCSVPTDAELQAKDGTLVGVHALVLLSRCTEAAPGRTVLECAPSGDLLKRVARALYTGRFDSTDCDDAIRGAAVFFTLGCADLLKTCEGQLMKRISAETVGNIAACADISGLDTLMEAARSFIGRNYKTVVESDEWNDAEALYPRLGDIARSVHAEKKSKKKK